jgi:hypothetical protein
MNLRTRRHNLIQQPDNMIALRLRHANDLRDEAGVKEDGLPACNGICADEGVLGCDGLAAHGAAEVAGALSLQLGGVQGGEGLEVSLHVRGEHVVGGVLGGPEGVAAAAEGWAGEDFEGGVGGGLDFVCYLGCVSGSCCVIWG